jgi:hypothetical protein
VGNHAAGYFLHALAEVVVVGARVEVLADTRQLLLKSTSTDQEGKFLVTGLPLYANVLLRVNFGYGGKAYQELHITRTTPSSQSIAVTTASTLVAAKMIATAPSLAHVDVNRLQAVISKVVLLPSQDEASVLLSEAKASAAFDRLADSQPELKSGIQGAILQDPLPSQPGQLSGDIRE